MIPNNRNGDKPDDRDPHPWLAHGWAWNLVTAGLAIMGILLAIVSLMVGFASLVVATIK